MEDSKAKIVLTVVFIILLFVCFGKIVWQYILLQNREYADFVKQEQDGSEHIRPNFNDNYNELIKE